ncbi:CLUMA_CG015119, isoform A [Clunio marinus]|uniref:CLUMA_CG015119, isoform A n=1 Tax=Clunio marinus TaxID=568069 RepID=A0A1J1IQN1_9DIPT|nr:CLUMA_CG015119, isoform A [Clunio marinus]
MGLDNEKSFSPVIMNENDDEKISKAPTTPNEYQKSNENEDASLGSQKVYKKTSSNQLLTLYLGTRELVSRAGVVDPIKGIIYIDPRVIESNQKVYCQLTLTFRYGREDEEVMGLKFCNEAIIALQQVWPKIDTEQQFDLTPLQEALIERLGRNSIPFMIEIGSITPPSVQLLPAKRYTGAPIGTSYDIRVYTVPTAEQADERIQRRSTVRLGIRLIHKICPEINLSNEPSQQPTVPRSLRLRLSPKARKLIKQTSLIIHGSNSGTNTNSNGNVKSIVETDVVDSLNRGPQGSVDKPFLWTEGRVNLKASLNKSAYTHGENVNVTIDVKNDSRKVVRKIRVSFNLLIKIFAVQHVDVCMFSNGKFKNIVAEVDVSKQIGSSETLHGVYSLLPIRGSTKNWIAVEGALFSTSNYDTSLAALNSKLASSAPRGSTYTPFQLNPQPSQSSSQTPIDERNVFAIYVSYYVKVKLSLSGMGGEVTLKLPFVLGDIEASGEATVDKNIQPNHSNDLHLNDHQTLNDIRRPNLDRSESLSETKYDENVCESAFSRNSSVNCKSIDYDDVMDMVTDMSMNNEGIDFINQKFSEMNRRNSEHSTDSSTSEVDETETNKQETSVIKAQVHCQKYLESDI